MKGGEVTNKDDGLGVCLFPFPTAHSPGTRPESNHSEMEADSVGQPAASSSGHGQLMDDRQPPSAMPVAKPAAVGALIREKGLETCRAQCP